MRIVAGEWGGRRLAGPSAGTRPTQDRVRQILFDLLGVRVARGPVLDLYAGTGALGLEALSRGAPEAVFVEADRRACAILQRNVSELGAGARCRVLPWRARRALARLEGAGDRFATILADPPYGDPEQTEILRVLGRSDCRLLLPGGCLVLETGVGDVVRASGPLLELVRSRRAGDTVLHIFERSGAD